MRMMCVLVVLRVLRACLTVHHAEGKVVAEDGLHLPELVGVPRDEADRRPLVLLALALALHLLLLRGCHRILKNGFPKPISYIGQA